MIDLPSRTVRKWESANNGDLFGSIVRTKNIELNKDGYASLARKAMVWYSKDDDSNFSTPVVIAGDDTYAYVITTDHAFAVDIASNTLPFTELTTSNIPSLGSQSDAVFYQGLLHVSGSTTVKSYSGGTGGSWTSRISGLSSSYPHPLCVNEQSQTLLVGDGNVLRQYSSGYSEDTTNQLTIPPQFIITGVRYRGNKAYVATKNIYGGEAKMFIWNCAGVGFNEAYGVGADWIYSMDEFESSMALVVSSGELLKFTGGGFEHLAAFPVFYTPYSWSSSASTSSLLGNVASRGMKVDGNVIYMNVDGSLRNSQTQYPGQYLPEQPSGLWSYSRATGLSHKASLNNKTKLTLTATENDSNYLKFSTAHQAQTGDPVLAASISGLAGLTAGQIYFAIVDDDASTTTCRLALSPDDATAGNYIAITGTPTSDSFVFDRYESMGQTKITNTGGLFVFSRTIPNLMYGSEVLFGANVLSVAGASMGAVMSLGMGRNVGHVVTPWISGNGIKDFIQKLYVLFNDLDLPSDSIVVKYRTKKALGFPKPLSYSGTQSWTSGTVLAVDTLTHGFKTVEDGDEIEFVLGSGAGYTAHVSSIDKSSSTYAVTIDETLPITAADKVDFVVEKWKKITSFGSESEAALNQFAEVTPENTKAKKVQFKIELRGRDVSLELLTIVNSVAKPAL